MAVKTLGFGMLAALALMAGCSDKELVLPGERLDPLSVTGSDTSTDRPIAAPADVVSVPVALGAPVANADWPQRAGSSRHQIAHLALGPTLTRVWTAPIGQGEDRKHRITADPVVGAGRVYTLDSRARVSATGTGGGAVWSTDLTPSSDRNDDASGGGLAYDGGRVYATTGFGELVALDAATGAVIWRQKVDAPVGGAPAVADGLVYAVARDGSAWAVRAADGKVEWQIEGAPSGSGIAGVSAPAVDDQLVLFPFATGQIVAADRKTGGRVWDAYVAGKRTGRAFANVQDLSGDPVIAGDTVYAGSSSGRMAAIGLRTGQVLWNGREGAVSPVVAAGGALFFVSDEDQLVRLDAGTGQKVWAIDMPYFIKDKATKRQSIHVHFGPVLAGGRLVVVSSDGLIRSFDPASGALLSTADLPGGAAAAPAVAGGTLYVVSRSGQLHAFR